MRPSSPAAPPRLRVLSGIQPSGSLHLGNYFGSIRPNLEQQGKAGESIFFVADLHALTTVQDAAVLRQARQDIILDYLACGFDPEKAIIFFQSDVLEHAELSWILSTVAPMGMLERAVSYKEKVQKGIAASVGLFTYPVLMAADILLYDTTHVPVGRDQKQHVEIARDLAIKFNATFGKDTLVVPEPVIRAEVAVVPGTDGQKMSKSYGNTIPIFGDEGVILKAIMGIVTDSKGVSEPKDPDKCIVYQLHKLFLSASESKDLAEQYRVGGLGYGEAKKLLLRAYLDHFRPMRSKRAELAQQSALVEEVTRAGTKRAQAIAAKTMERVRKAVGLL
ncbi:MAG: tryptophan--tRNA ligase [Candidatus Peribacteraceae bacterium]|nr:tryptophan--tRNA ligase [Candidatus Peribacteraceae bacterium]MDD5742338.1 tryptophan--tRNA ligase [Candidatus Peribacteraceae bacterium]